VRAVTVTLSGPATLRPVDLGRLVKPPRVIASWKPPHASGPTTPKTFAPPDAWEGFVMPDLNTLERVLNGLRNL
jgi:hypothetical protein